MKKTALFLMIAAMIGLVSCKEDNTYEDGSYKAETEDFSHLDEYSRRIMQKTIAFFEGKGKQKMKQDHFDRVWYDDFLTF